MLRPSASEYAPYYEKYVSLVPDGDILAVLESQTAAVLAELRQVSEEKSLHRYAAGKWTIRESFLHVADTERIFAYRALRFGRGDQQPLASFDQDAYIVPSEANARSWASIVDEVEAARRATLALLRHLPAAAYERSGEASGKLVTVRALAYMIAGHELHHMALLRDKYLA